MPSHPTALASALRPALPSCPWRSCAAAARLPLSAAHCRWFGTVLAAAPAAPQPPALPASPHIPVLVNAVVAHSSPALTLHQAPPLIVDATFGAGGHARALLAAFPSARLLAIDRDPLAIDMATRLTDTEPLLAGRLVPVRARFSQLFVAMTATAANFASPRPASHGRAHVLLADLGVSSMQLDTPERGFSFRSPPSSPLDMRMSPDVPGTAADLVNSSDAATLARLMRDHADERFAPLIARAIVDHRARSGPITSAAQLARIVSDAYPARARSHMDIHPATRTFQALRMAVNNELGELETLLSTLPQAIAPGGRALIISFHSGEDRLVKQTFANSSVWRPVTNKPIEPDSAEVAANPRSRSAKLRVAERLP
jgi:16S rRNA (cytosine1402-N4)-methyltransferase